jgi:hypothetical protein
MYDTPLLITLLENVITVKLSSNAGYDASEILRLSLLSLKSALGDNSDPFLITQT